MQAERSEIPRVVFLVTGFAVGAITRLLASRSASEVAALKRSLADLEADLARRESMWRERYDTVELRLEQHENRLNEVPTTTQIVSAMEDLLGKTMHSLDQRLETQAQAVDLLRTTVSQTDMLLERVLASLESLRQDAGDSAPSRTK